MTNTELAELMLTRLFDIAEKEGHHSIVDLMDEARSLGVTDQGKVHNVAEYLNDRGLINATHTMSGPIAHITGSGAIFVERGGDTGIIPKYRAQPSTYVVNIDKSTNIHGNVSNSNIAVNSNNVTQSLSIQPEVNSILDKMVSILQHDNVLSKEILGDALQDIEALKIQLLKTNKNKSTIEAIINTLGNISSIASLSIQLLPLIFK